MTNEYLDKVLTLLAKSKNYTTTYNELWNQHGPDLITQAELNAAIDFLKTKGYIRSAPGLEHTLYVEGKGRLFVENGGFSGEESYKKEILHVAKDSKKYAKRAYVLGIIAIGISLLLFLLDKWLK